MVEKRERKNLEAKLEQLWLTEQSQRAASPLDKTLESVARCGAQQPVVRMHQHWSFSEGLLAGLQAAAGRWPIAIFRPLAPWRGARPIPCARLYPVVWPTVGVGLVVVGSVARAALVGCTAQPWPLHSLPCVM